VIGWMNSVRARGRSSCVQNLGTNGCIVCNCQRATGRVTIKAHPDGTFRNCINFASAATGYPGAVREDKEMKDAEPASLDIARLRAGFRARALSASALIETILDRIAAAGDDRVWISRVPTELLRARAAALDTMAAGMSGGHPRAVAAVRYPLRGKGQHRHRGLTDDRCLPRFFL
jgi:hypothetical protein